MKNGPYELIKVPESYPGPRYRNGLWAYEHTVVWWQHTGEVPPPGYIIHHKNDKKRDNRFSNLELKERGAHSREHGESSIRHGMARYVKGCRCAVCRAANARRTARYRARLRGEDRVQVPGAE